MGVGVKEDNPKVRTLHREMDVKTIELWDKDEVEEMCRGLGGSSDSDSDSD